MFNIFKSVKAKVSISVSNNSSSQMGDISQAKENTQERDENRRKQSEILYNEALNLIDQFKINNTYFDILIEAANKLEESLKYNRSKGEGYFWLAYIFYIFGENENANELLSVSESITPDYPQIKELKSIISYKRSN